jgi:integrase
MRIPKYGHHKPTGQARVYIHGRCVYLGKHGTKASREKYARLIAELDTPPIDHGGELAVVELIHRFYQHCKARYVKNGKQTSEVRSYRFALGIVSHIYGAIGVSEFGPLKLQACVSEMVGQGIFRRRINGHLYRIRRCFKWGVSQEIVPESIWRALQSVEGVRNGAATEGKPVTTVPTTQVNKVKPFVSRQVWAMIRLQLLTGCRPEEACLMRTIDLNTQGVVWEYRPHSHKTEHHDKSRVVMLGPKAQAVIKPFLRTDLYARLFQPKEAREEWLASVRKKSRKRVRSPKRTAGIEYTVGAYGHAVAKACKKAGIPRWSPNRLRHTRLTEVRHKYGLEAAQVIGGHANAKTTEIYAERDMERARSVMRRTG